MKPIITRFDKNSGDILLSIPMFDKDIFHRIQQIEKCNPSWFDAEHYNIFDLIKENQELKKQLEENKNPLREIFSQVNDDMLLRNCGAMQSEIDTYKNQQKEFIEYLEEEMKKNINWYNSLTPHDKNYYYKDYVDKDTNYMVVLSKYKEIIGVSNEK